MSRCFFFFFKHVFFSTLKKRLEARGGQRAFFLENVVFVFFYLKKQKMFEMFF